MYGQAIHLEHLGKDPFFLRLNDEDENTHEGQPRRRRFVPGTRWPNLAGSAPEKETVWLSQRQMAELFDKDSDTTGLHIRNIFKEGELDATSTTEESSVVQDEGARRIRRQIRLYDPDVIISVGYRVKSRRGTQFRIWATTVLRDHPVKGCSANERRLKELRQSLRLVEEERPGPPLHALPELAPAGKPDGVIETTC